MKHIVNIFVLFCYLSTSLWAMEPDNGAPYVPRRLGHPPTEQTPKAPPSRWKTVCSTAKEFGWNSLNFLTFRTARQSPSVQKMMFGGLYLGMGVTGIILSSKPTDEELASADFIDHTLRNARDMYYFKSCVYGMQLLVDPLLAPFVRRLTAPGSAGAKPFSQHLVPFYEGAVSVIAGSGTIGYCRDMDATYLSKVGYAVGGILLLRGGQHLVLLVTDYDPLSRLHRHFKKSTLEYFLFTTENSPFRHIMDGVAEVIAALTLHHALWPFVYDEFLDTPTQYLEELRPNQAQKVRKEMHAKNFLHTDNHICLREAGKTTCSPFGKGYILGTEGPARSEEWSPGWMAEERYLIKKGQEIDVGTKEHQLFFSFGGIFKKYDRYSSVWYLINKAFSRPYFSTTRGVGSLEYDHRFFPILMPYEKWFKFENRYIYSLLGHSWIAEENLLSLNTLNRFMLGQGIINITRGVGGVFHAANKAFQALVAYQNLKIAEEEPGVQPSKRRRKYVKPYNILASSSEASSPPLSSVAPLPKPPAPPIQPVQAAPRRVGDKPKTHKEGYAARDVKDEHTPTTQTSSKKESQTPHETPSSIQEVLDHHNRTLKREKFMQCKRDLETLGVHVKEDGNQFKFERGNNSLTIHLKHKPGKGGQELYGCRLNGLRDFIQIVLFLARQDQGA